MIYTSSMKGATWKRGDIMIDKLKGYYQILCKIPVFSPKLIKWQYPLEEKQQIEGDSYLIEETSNYDPNIWYRITCTGQLDDHYGRTYIFTSWTYYQIDFKGTFQTIQYGWGDPVLDDVVNSGELVYITWTGFFGMYVKVLYKDINNVTQIATSGGINPRPDHDYGMKRSYPLENIQISRVDGEPILPSYKFTIFDSNGNTIHQETRSVPPVVEIMPARCEYPDKPLILREIWLFASDELDMRFFIENGEYTGEILMNNSVIETKKSPSGCTIYPKFSLEQLLEYCPAGTCAISCGDVVCCYNGNGESIKEIPWYIFGGTIGENGK